MTARYDLEPAGEEKPGSNLEMARMCDEVDEAQKWYWLVTTKWRNGTEESELVEATYCSSALLACENAGPAESPWLEGIRVELIAKSLTKGVD